MGAHPNPPALRGQHRIGRESAGRLLQITSGPLPRVVLASEHNPLSLDAHCRFKDPDLYGNDDKESSAQS
jgi:hypothetical protein